MIRLHAVLAALCSWGVCMCAGAPSEPSPPDLPLPPRQPPQVLVSVKYNPRGSVDGLVVAQYRVAAPVGAGGVATPNVTGDHFWYPRIAERRSICTDLCTAGLGGLSCGQSCADVTPSQLVQLFTSRTEQSNQNKILKKREDKDAGTLTLHFDVDNEKLEKEKDKNSYKDKDRESKRDKYKRKYNDSPKDKDKNVDGTADNEQKENSSSNKENDDGSNSNLTFDEPRSDSSHHLYMNAPRVEVCPTLCMNQLGWPLCDCSAAPPNPMPWAGPTSQLGRDLHWGEVCSSFCPLSLRGCPACDAIEPDVYAGNAMPQSGYNLLTTNAGWIEWCTYQCSRGDGGAACNCDRAPFF